MCSIHRLPRLRQLNRRRSLEGKHNDVFTSKGILFRRQVCLLFYRYIIRLRADSLFHSFDLTSTELLKSEKNNGH